jgi:hypothetical protein
MLERPVSVMSVNSSFAAYITVKGIILFIVLMGRESSVMRMYVCYICAQDLIVVCNSVVCSIPWLTSGKCMLMFCVVFINTGNVEIMNYKCVPVCLKFRHWENTYYIYPHMGWVWASPMQSLLGPSPTGLMTIFYCFKFETLPTWRARFLYSSFPPCNRVAQLYPQALSNSRLSLTGPHYIIILYLML